MKPPVLRPFGDHKVPPLRNSPSRHTSLPANNKKEGLAAPSFPAWAATPQNITIAAAIAARKRFRTRTEATPRGASEHRPSYRPVCLLNHCTGTTR